MKKYLTIMMMLFVCAIPLIAQEIERDTIPADIITGGESIGEILKNNWAVIAIIIYSILEFWLGKTEKIKEGSFLHWAFNLIGKFIRKQIPSVKGKFMTEDQIKMAKRTFKTIALLIMFSAISVGAYAQDGWFSQFNKKTKGTKTELLKGEGDTFRKFYVKPAASLSAINLVYNSETKKWGGSPFTAGGVGGGIQHYTEHNGALVNDYGLNALFIINMEDPTNVGFGAAATVNFIGFVDVGGGRDFTNKQWLVLFGANWTF